MGNFTSGTWAHPQSTFFGKESHEYYGTMEQQKEGQHILPKHNNIKLMFIGPSLVGKTTFINSYINQDYTKHEPTMGVDYTVISKNKIDYHIYDTTGIREYRHILCSYYGIVQAYIIMIEHSNMNYKNIISEFYRDISEHKKGSQIIYLLINVKNTGKTSQNIDMSSYIIELCKKLDNRTIIYKLDVTDKDSMNDTMEKILDTSAEYLIR